MDSASKYMVSLIVVIVGALAFIGVVGWGAWIVIPKLFIKLFG